MSDEGKWDVSRVAHGAKWDVGVVGAGPGGLSTAHELQKTGKFNITVFEAGSQVGGRASTRVKDGLAFDRGANFYVLKYKSTEEAARELGLGSLWQVLPQEPEHYTVRDGKLCLLTIPSVWSLFRLNTLSIKSQFRLIKMFWSVGKKCKGLNWFDLASLPVELNTTNAYDYVAKHADQQVADYIIDAFTSMYQFHSAREMSLAAMFALMGMMVNDSGGFVRCHVKGGEMSAIPEAYAKGLDVRLNHLIDEVRSDGCRLLVVSSGGQTHTFDKVVMATTADVARKIYITPSDNQKRFLDSVEYAATVNVSFKIPIGTLKGIACVAVPFCENSVISEYTNEELKGISSNGKTLVNVGLHEGAAREIIGKSNEEIFSFVKGELLKVCPPLKGNASLLENHDLERWPAAMPKFSQRFVDEAIRFWQRGQGENGVYLAGDMTGCPWVEGAIYSGKKVAKLIEGSI